MQNEDFNGELHLSRHHPAVEGDVGEDGEGEDQAETQQPPGDRLEERDPPGPLQHRLHLLIYHCQSSRDPDPRR